MRKKINKSTKDYIKKIMWNNITRFYEDNIDVPHYENQEDELIRLVYKTIENL